MATIHVDMLQLIDSERYTMLLHDTGKNNQCLSTLLTLAAITPALSLDDIHAHSHLHHQTGGCLRVDHKARMIASVSGFCMQVLTTCEDHLIVFTCSCNPLLSTVSQEPCVAANARGARKGRHPALSKM